MRNGSSSRGHVSVVVFLHWRELLSALGSFGIAAQILFILGMALAVYTRNGSAMLVAITAFPQLDPNLLAMILPAVPVPLAVWLLLSSYLASRAGKAEAGGAA